jgi:ubiquinol-cytochrome c reductase cytochrome c subunit
MSSRSRVEGATIMTRHHAHWATFAALAGLTAASAQVVAADATRGRQLFVTDGCYECHGYNGQGGSVGPRLAPNPLSLEAISAFIRNSAGAMPPFTVKVLPEADLADIHAYLAGLPPAPDPKTIPLLAN